MRQKPALLFLLAAAMAVLAGCGTAWAAPMPINLLPLGDSITQAGLYFSPLTTLLSNNGYVPTILANEGHSGYIIEGNIPGAPRIGLEENIAAFMNHPGVNAANSYVLLMIGTNDVDQGFLLQETDVPNVQTRLGRLISSIESIAPKAHLIVAQITPNLGSIAKDTAVQQFNKDVAASVATAKAAGGNVSLVNMYDPFHPSLYAPYTGTSNPYMNDALHPNQAGGNVMAQVWFDGIQATQTPEPSTLVLLIAGLTAGLVALLAYAWRKRSRLTI